MKPVKQFPYNGKPAILVTVKQRKDAYEKGIGNFLQYGNHWYLKTCNIDTKTKFWAQQNNIKVS